MALNAYLTIKGSKQGSIKGSVTQKGREGQIAVYGFQHSIVSPRDPQSGLPTGKRMHKPIFITKELDKSTPLLMTALVTNENITDFTLRFFSPTINASAGTGTEVQNYTIKLTNASIISPQRTDHGVCIHMFWLYQINMKEKNPMPSPFNKTLRKGPCDLPINPIKIATHSKAVTKLQKS